MPLRTKGSGIVKIVYTPAEVRFWHIFIFRGLSQTVQCANNLNTFHLDKQEPYLYASGTLQAMQVPVLPIHTNGWES